MKRSKILFITGVVLGILVVLLGTTLLFLNRNSTDELVVDEQIPTPANINDLEKEEVTPTETKEEIQEQESDIYVLKESGWIPNWGFDLGFESLKSNQGIIDTVNPVLYTVDKSGNVVSRGVSNTNISNLLTYGRENNIRVIPTVGSYDFESMAAAFSTPESYVNQINTIVSEIEKYGFDGIDLDYEMINSQYKDNFINFLRDLKTELNKKDKVLSVTVFAQWDNATYNDHQETRSVQDYMLIGRIADEVRIMAYDYTLQSSKVPGPIGPVDWIRDILDYATKNISREKVWLGVHLYGYQWSDTRTVAFTYTTTLSAIINSPNISNVFKDDIGEGYAEFSCDGGLKCVAYFQDVQGVNMRRDIAKEYNIAGVSYWRLGGEMDILK